MVSSSEEVKVCGFNLSSDMARGDFVGGKLISESSVERLEKDLPPPPLPPPEKKPRLETDDDDVDSPQQPPKEKPEIVGGESSGESKQSSAQPDGDKDEEEEEEEEEEGSRERKRGRATGRRRARYYVPTKAAEDVNLLGKLGLQKARNLEEFIRNGRAICESGICVPDIDCRPSGIGKVVDKGLIEEYIRQIKESDGFDVTVYPGPCPVSSFIPLNKFKKKPKLHKRLVCLAELALDKFNKDHKDEEGTPYEFHQIERATTLPCAGQRFHITFQARQSGTAVLKTFQTKVYDRIGRREVQLIRLK